MRITIQELKLIERLINQEYMNIVQQYHSQKSEKMKVELLTVKKTLKELSKRLNNLPLATDIYIKGDGKNVYL